MLLIVLQFGSSLKGNERHVPLGIPPTPDLGPRTSDLGLQSSDYVRDPKGFGDLFLGGEKAFSRRSLCLSWIVVRKVDQRCWLEPRSGVRMQPTAQAVGRKWNQNNPQPAEREATTQTVGSKVRGPKSES